MHDSIFHGLFGGEAGRGWLGAAYVSLPAGRWALLSCKATYPLLPLRHPPAGYCFYSHLVSTRMLPLRRLVRWSRTAHSQLGFDAGDRRVLFAASHK